MRPGEGKGQTVVVQADGVDHNLGAFGNEDLLLELPVGVLAFDAGGKVGVFHSFFWDD
jgi:hypothetical protein